MKSDNRDKIIAAVKTHIHLMNTNVAYRTIVERELTLTSAELYMRHNGASEDEIKAFVESYRKETIRNIYGIKSET